MSSNGNIAISGALALCLAILLAPASAAGEGVEPSPSDAGAGSGTPAYATRAKVDWKARVFLIDIDLDLAAAGLRMPQGRLEAQRLVEHDFPGLAQDAIFALQADSYRTIEAAVADGTLEADRLVALASRARQVKSALSRDMRKYQATYELGLEAISEPFLSGARPTPIRAPMEAAPSKDYSGIIVYAKGELPVHGEGVEAAAAPALFPRIYDEDMRLVLDRTVVAPEVLAAKGPSGGVLGYASALDAEAGERVGDDPMRVMAKELFGDSRCDYVISKTDALRILSNPNNRELLRQGKVVVVLDF